MICYDEPLFRPPSEAYSLILQITLGCSWNKCTFCDMYTTKKFRPRPFKDIEREINHVADSYPGIEKIFLADGDALVLSNSRLIPILNRINEKFKGLKQITSYATPQNILNKPLSDLKELKSAGLKMIYYGVESGDPVILKKIQKGATHDEIKQGIIKAREAGIKVSTTNLLGIAGLKYSNEHAINTAKLLSDANPEYISYLMVMFPLGDGRFISAFGDDYAPIDQRGLLCELKTTLEHLEVKNSIIRANHASNYLPIKAVFPQDKYKTINFITEVINAPTSPLIRPEYLRGL
ncbi:MAG: radical SAM protein [Deltaproteobacteria bacterium]|nr:radical SAM protein [Deltaproteobacteria bacterium]